MHRASTDAPVTVVISATDVTDARQNAGMVSHLLRSARTIAFVGTDLAGRITLFNTGAEHMLGIDADRCDRTRARGVHRPGGPGPQRCPRPGPDRLRGTGGPRGRRPRPRDAGLDVAARRSVAAEGLDDHQPRDRHLRRPLRLPLRRQRHHRHPPQPGDPGQGPAARAPGRRAAQGHRPGQGRLHHHGQPRAAYADEQHHRQRGDARRRDDGRAGARAAAGDRGDHPQRRPPARAGRRPAAPGRLRPELRAGADGSGRPARRGRGERGRGRRRCCPPAISTSATACPTSRCW